MSALGHGASLPHSTGPTRSPAARPYDETLTQPLDMAALLAEQERLDA